MERDNRWEQFVNTVAAAVAEKIIEMLKREALATPKIAQRYMTVKECAAYTGFSPIAIYRMAEKGEIPFSRHGRKLTFDRVEIDAWMSRRRAA